MRCLRWCGGYGQVGNEIDNGLLWPEVGQPCNDSGALYYQPDCAAQGGNWPQLGALLKAGAAAVRAACPTSIIMIHSSRGSGLSGHNGLQAVAAYYANVSEQVR